MAQGNAIGCGRGTLRQEAVTRRSGDGGGGEVGASASGAPQMAGVVMVKQAEGTPHQEAE